MKDSTLHQSKTVSALTDIGRHISSSLDYKEIAHNCLISLAENLDLEKCALLMPCPDGKTLGIKVGIDWDKNTSDNLNFPISASPPGRVFSTGLPVAVQNVEDLPGLYIPESKENFDYMGFIAVPVTVNRIPIGVLIGYKVSNLTMLDEDVNVMKIVASILSQTLKLAELVEDKSRALRMENQKLHAELQKEFSITNMISSSSAMDKTLDIVKRVGSTEAAVLLRGESGTGKTMLARGIHYFGPRKEGPLVIINCASIPENLIESELFGHEKGSFTGAINRRIGKFEAARGGTIFLDEIGEISLDTQAKLLRIIQDGKFERVGSNETLATNARLICATNADLEAKLKNREFREDLYYRLMVVPVVIPSLRERGADILPLIHHFLDRFNAKYSRKVSISLKGLHVLEDYSWPGNVRELENTIERMVILAVDENEVIEEIPFLKRYEEAASAGNREFSRHFTEAGDDNRKREPYERVPLLESRVKDVLTESAGIQTLASRKLGISLRQLRYAVKKFGINIHELKR